MIHYDKIAPHPLLRKYIANYWLLASDSASSLSLRDLVMPDTFTDIIFNFGDPFIRSNENVKSEIFSKRSFVSGIMKKPRIVGLQGKIDAIGISFKPECVSAFLSVPMNGFADAVISLNDVLGSQTRPLEELLLEKESVSDRLKTIEDFMCRIASKSAQPDQVIEASVRHISFRNGLVDLGDLETLTGYSRRQIERKFLYHVGVGPKFLAKVIRFRKALGLLEKPGASLAAAAFDAGYSDQAHLTRDVKGFTGLTPGSFLRKKTADVVFIQD